MAPKQTMKSLPRILVIDDELAIRRYLHSILSHSKYVLHEANNGRDGLAAAAAYQPDVILLDLGLPDLDGIEVIRRIRDGSRVPIIVISVRSHENDKVAALDAGANDYLTKPFGASELLARIRVAIRDSNKTSDLIFSSGGLVMDQTRRLVTIYNEEVQLTPTEYSILRLLIAHAGMVLTQGQILKQVWADEACSEHSHLLRVNISNLRHKIEADPSHPRHIITEPGVGYRLKIWE